jgi:hypothetical protein
MKSGRKKPLQKNQGLICGIAFFLINKKLKEKIVFVKKMNLFCYL